MLDSILEPVTDVELLKEVFTSRTRWMPLIIEWNASANMFYLLKHLLLLIFVICKLKCNNLILKEIMILNSLYLCLHAFSLHRESPDPDPGRWTPHFWGGSITLLKNNVSLIYKGRSSLIRDQARKKKMHLFHYVLRPSTARSSQFITIW
jgi:hypothetical protein